MGLNNTVLISGASTGIGQCTAIELAKNGFTVLAGYRNPNDEARLIALHPLIHPIQLDITQPESIDSAVHRIQHDLHVTGLTGLINNAGIAIGGPLEFIPIEALRRQLEINVIGHIAVTQTCLPLIRKRRGRIVNIGSIAGLNALPFVGPYSASKFALEALTDAMRIELQPWGIQVSIIEPGSIKTPIWEKSMAEAEYQATQLPPEFTELYGDAIETLKQATLRSARRGIHPEAVAKAVLHALTEKKPHTRYLIGRDAHLRQCLTWLPDRVRDWLITHKVGFPHRNAKLKDY